MAARSTTQRLQAGIPLTKGDIANNARALIPFLNERGPAIEKARRLPADVVKKLREAGVFRMNMPKIWGGPELTSVEQCEVLEDLGRGDASAAWCVMIGCDSGIYSGYLDDGVARDLYPKLDTIQAGFVTAIGIAERVRGGYRVSGEWPFGSGSTHCDLLAAGCVVVKDGSQVMRADGQPEQIVVIGRPSDFVITDTWYTTGLCGSGSNDYLCSKLFVPEENTFSFQNPAKRDGTTWRRADTLLRKMPGVPLGIARAALDTVMAIATRKQEGPPNKRLHEDKRVWTELAECEAIHGSARAYLHNSLATQWATLERGATLSVRERAHVSLSRINAFQSARKVVQRMYDLLGATAIYARKSPLDRQLRDIQTICQHFAGQAKGFERVGGIFANPDGKDLPFI